MRLNDWAVSIDLTDAYLHVPIHHQSRKYLRFVHEDQIGLTVRNVSKSVDIFETDGRCSSVSMPTCHIGLPVLDDWLIKNLIRNRLITQTRFCIQIFQSLGFLPNLKKSDLFPSQKFTFIGMEF